MREDARVVTRRRAVLGLAAGLLPFSRRHLAAAEPALRTVRILIGFPPGGQSDPVARLLAEALRGHYAAAVVVENRVGASGRLAVEAMRNAEADGTTLLLTPSDPLTIFPHLYGARLRYDPFTDLMPVGLICVFHLGLAAGPANPARNLGEFVAWARGQPSVSYGIPGYGTLPHFLGVQLGRMAGIALTPVAYRGDGPAVQDVLGGQIPLSVNALPSVVPLAEAGQLRLLAVTTPQRLPSLLQVPTIAEEGHPSLAFAGWQGVLLPARAPTAAVMALSTALSEALTRPELREGIARLGLVPAFESPPEFAARMVREHAAWGPVVAASGFRPED